MLKKTITYIDYNDKEQTDTFYFNLSKSELTKMNERTEGGLEAKINKIIESKNGKEIMDTFDEIIGGSVGEKSVDGKRFIKNDEIRDNFMQSAAYEVLFEELCTNANAAAEFIKGILPKELVDEAAKSGKLIDFKN